MNRQPRSGLLIVALGALALGACECIKTVPQCPDGVKCLTYDQYCDQANQSLWTMGQVCGVIAKDVPYPSVYPQRDARCTEELRVLIDAGTVSFNVVAAQLCIEARQTTCDPVCRWDLPLAAPWTGGTPRTRCSAPCDRIFTGTKESGESCSLSAECLEGLWCDTTTACPGRCARQVSEGDTAPTLEACRTPIANPLTDGGFRCESLVDAGERCEKGDDEYEWHHCQPGYACAHRPPHASDGGDDAGADGGPGDAGADAGTDGGVVDAGPEPFFCLPLDAGVLDLFCDVSGCPYGSLCSGDTVPGYVCSAFGDAGAACEPGGLGPAKLCLGGLQCLLDGGTTSCGKATEGTPCGVGSQCAPQDFCGSDGGCTSSVGPGQSCATAPCELGLLCAAGSDGGFVCGTPSTLGGACGDDGGHACAYGFDCFDGGCRTSACLPSP